MFLSFIVPVYNAEGYLAECLNSLENQDIPKEDYEILCVNDGSTDSSPSILAEFAGKYPNLTVIHKENGGVTTARNAGLDAAQGDYIWFVDADDFIKPGILSSLRSTAMETNCDRLIVGGYQFTDMLTQEEAAQSRRGELPINAPWYDAVVWRSLIRRDFLRKNGLFFRYPELTHGEDGLFMYELSLHCPSSAEIEEALYFYREHSGSAETVVSMENSRKKLRSYVSITKILDGYYATGRTDAGTANLRMTFAWFALNEAAKFPASQTRGILRELHRDSLFPSRRLEKCTLTRSFMTDRTDWLGKAFDSAYLHLHRPWGFAVIWTLHHLRALVRSRP